MNTYCLFNNNIRNNRNELKDFSGDQGRLAHCLTTQ